jgi:hypothetical protein
LATRLVLLATVISARIMVEPQPTLVPGADAEHYTQGFA